MRHYCGLPGFILLAASTCIAATIAGSVATTTSTDIGNSRTITLTDGTRSFTFASPSSAIFSGPTEPCFFSPAASPCIWTTTATFAASAVDGNDVTGSVSGLGTTKGNILITFQLDFTGAQQAIQPTVTSGGGVLPDRSAGQVLGVPVTLTGSIHIVEKLSGNCLWCQSIAGTGSADGYATSHVIPVDVIRGHMLYTIAADPVPEPGTLTLAVLGLTLTGLARVRRG